MGKERCYSYLGKTINVVIDRPKGSIHPKYKDHIYPINYGYVEGEIAPDGEELDVYIIGLEQPVDEYIGQVVAIIHRKNDVEDKLVILKKGSFETKKEIEKAVYFQERFFDSEIEMYIPKTIHILGASGSGTTTLGNALSEKYGYSHFDSDDYFWLNTDPPYTTKRPTNERQKLLLEDISKVDKCVITGSLCGWGDIFIDKFDLVIYIETKTDIRLERLKQREYANWGDRILKGGDMYDSHQLFLDWASLYDVGGLDMRSHASHMEWLKEIVCPILYVDGANSVYEMVKKLELE